MNKKRVLYFSIPILILFIILSFFIDIKIAAIVFFSVILLMAYVACKEKVGQELIIAFLLAFAVTSYYNYTYTTANIFIGKINLFPLISWTFGLVLLREIYEKMKDDKFAAITLLYVVSLFVFEYMGYYVFDIRLASSFPSLLGLGIIHAPIGMKIFYILAGPVYILVTDYLKVR